ncbi:branched-chain amino acid transport system II carrier protein [Enterococcus cecorum]|uniref:Branched-chain amino acid transport system carrier protein n=1 Tax=Enterococcus cecorum TaxID=44008 RepID=A0A0H2Q806_9ENTE|nr:branched-chain amino acid transport system II carrier protein [Enterococcus cecorum]KLN93165.1 branched-chain amino acid transporter II carrier protein [Enterococcus cecorum]KLN93397.1 branched-chain amino acid transporter II carrier protein [Enterococcus cecorum]KLO65909.1 branched-chain amino acid transporter II carrier protein [Enterococcus cecorum]KLO72894.1 branched-chain amino acid transporter II carrier protein [Enterococcus cecorum]MCJ0521537.1 branched-chain amino acid transport sy
MEKKLSSKDYLYLGSMLFGLFFGAGNLIFPVHMGQEAGANVWPAIIGFLITGIGLPFLGIIAIGISGENGLFDLASRVHKGYGYFFTVALYLVIGPFFAMPRLAATSFEIGLTPFVAESQKTLFLAIFSILFFALSWWFSRNPSKLLDYVGKFLNPLFLALLAILIVMSFVKPMANIHDITVLGKYRDHAFFTGFQNGYNTLDVLASLAFGIIVVNTLKNKGVTKKSTITADTFKSGAVSVLLMGIIYSFLSLMGTMSMGKFDLSDNGGIALAQIAHYYLGTGGSIILALIVVVACLKTTIGLTTAFSETFAELFPGLSYSTLIAGVSIIPCIIANVGLTSIISYSTPVLMFLYPLAIILVLLGVSGPLFKNNPIVYQTVTIFTIIPALIDGLQSSPEWIQNASITQKIIEFAKNTLPFFGIGMGWIVPAVFGLILGLGIYLIKEKL